MSRAALERGRFPRVRGNLPKGIGNARGKERSSERARSPSLVSETGRAANSPRATFRWTVLPTLPTTATSRKSSFVKRYKKSSFEVTHLTLTFSSRGSCAATHSRTSLFKFSNPHTGARTHGDGGCAGAGAGACTLHARTWEDARTTGQPTKQPTNQPTGLPAYRPHTRAHARTLGNGFLTGRNPQVGSRRAAAAESRAEPNRTDRPTNAYWTDRGRLGSRRRRRRISRWRGPTEIPSAIQFLSILRFVISNRNLFLKSSLFSSTITLRLDDVSPMNMNQP